MYNNIGIKLKSLAKAIFMLGSIGSFILCVVFFTENAILIGLVSMLVGIFTSLVISLFVYGFGELVDKVCKIERNMCSTYAKSETEINDFISEEKSKSSEDESSDSFFSNKEPKHGGKVKSVIIEKCDLCGREAVKGADCKIVDNLGTRYREVCVDCIKQNEESIIIL